MIKNLKKKNKLILCFAVIVSGLILYASDDQNVIAHIIALLVLTSTACTLEKADIYHPYVWFSTFFWVYSCAYPILYLTGYSTDYGYTKEIMVYQWVALSTILMVLPANKVVFFKSSNVTARNDKVLVFTENVVLIYIVIVIALILRGSYQNKTAIYASENVLFTIAFSAAYFAILIYCYIIFGKLNKFHNRKCYGSIIKSGFVICLFAIITGERDYMFSFILVTLVILFYYRIISKKQLFCLIPVGIVLIPISSMFKYFILSGNISGTFTLENLLVEVLDSEFISAGRNLQILVLHDCKNFWAGKTIINDFVRIFYDTGYSNQTWFNQTFFSSSHSTQYGFTLVGEGYVNGGVFGIIVVFLICGLLLRVLYKNAVKNQFYMIIYLYMIPLFIYSIRADLANIFSPLIKYALLGTGIIWILHHLVIGKRRKNV